MKKRIYFSEPLSHLEPIYSLVLRFRKDQMEIHNEGDEGYKIKRVKITNRSHVRWGFLDFNSARNWTLLWHASALSDAKARQKRCINQTRVRRRKS
jgi:hypothetical protein